MILTKNASLLLFSRHMDVFIGRSLCASWRCAPLSTQPASPVDVSGRPAAVACRVDKSSPKLTAFCQMAQVRYNSTADPGDDGVEARVKENLRKMREGKFDDVTHPEDLHHFKSTPGKETVPIPGAFALPHPIWSPEELHDVQISHKKPVGIIEHMAYYSVQIVRRGFDIFSGFNKPDRGEKVWLNRLSFLETVAGVPGMVAAMVRHLHSLRRMRRDHAWIHTLLEEAENERMHLMTVLQLKQPTVFFRTMVVVTQGIFVSSFSVTYLLSPRFCHRFVGYLEEEAVITYTKLLEDIDEGGMQHWKTQPAPKMAINYWVLEPGATMRDVILAIRADEAHHRVVNHTLASMKPDDYNPYKPGE